MQYQVIKTYQFKEVISVEADSEEEAIEWCEYMSPSFDNINEELISIDVQIEPDIWQIDYNEYNS